MRKTNSTTPLMIADADMAATFAGGSVSSIIDIKGNTLSGFIVPAGIVGTLLTVSVSVDGTTFYNAKLRDGTDYAYTLTGQGFYIAEPFNTSGFQFIRFLSDAVETGTIQAVGRVME